jgi:hypothetical protein
MTERQICKTMVGFDDGNVQTVDTIEHDAKLWLVPYWLDQRALRRTRPNRLIRLDLLPHRRSQSPHYDFVLDTTMPTALFRAKPLQDVQEAKGFEVLELPDLWFELLDEDKKPQN